jgi:hypothetical protein
MALDSLDVLVSVFLEERRKELDALLAAVGANDFDAMRRVARRMRQAGNPYGFAAISLMSDDIDQAAETSDKRKLIELVGEYARYLSRMRLIA